MTGTPLGTGDKTAVRDAAYGVAILVANDHTWKVDVENGIRMTLDIAAFTITAPDGNEYTVAVSPVR